MSRNFLKLFFLSCLLAAGLGCATKTVAPRLVMTGEIRDALQEKKGVTEIDAAFSIAFEKGDSEMKGDGALTISKSGDLDLRVYSFGFPALEVTVSDGRAVSSPRIDRNRMRLLTEGLRDCIFWWNIDNYTLHEDNRAFILTNSHRKVWIDRSSFLPIKQVVSIGDGSELTVQYDETAREKGIWYQSRMKLQYLQSAVTLSVKTLSVKSGNSDCIFCSL